MKENFYAINRESAIAKAQEWAKTNNKFIVKLRDGSLLVKDFECERKLKRGRILS